jgi:putative membrane protein
MSNDGAPAASAGADGADGQSGNRARDHLANERTYLAWLRTAIGLLALAAAIARFGSINLPRDKVAVAVCGLLGVLVLAIGTNRYYQVSRDLESGLFKMSTRAPMAISLAVLGGTLVVLLLLA